MTRHRTLPASMVLLALAVLTLSAAPAAAVPANLAPTGNATASSEGFGAIAADGNDGNRDGAFGNGSVFHTIDPDTAAFWQVDLGANHFLDRVQIFPRTDAAQGSVENFRIEVFDVGNNLVFTKDYLTADSTRDSAWGTNDLRNAFGSRVRLTRLDGAPSFMTFAEFEVYGQDTLIAPNIALGKTVTASQAPGFGAQDLDGIDGDINGQFFVADNTSVPGDGPGPVYHNSNQNVAGQFWQLDLGQTESIDYINLFSRTDFSGNSGQARVDVLAEDGVTAVFSQDITWFTNELGATRYNQTLDLTDIDGRFVRITNTLSGGNNFLTFAEVEVFANIAIPEPASLTLLALSGLTLLRRRREQA